MEPVLASVVSDALTLRSSSTAVDLTGFTSPSSSADRDMSTIDQFSPIEMDFEARNWRGAKNALCNNHNDQKRLADFLNQYETPQTARDSCTAASNKASGQYAAGVGGILSKIDAFMKIGDVAMKSAPESVGLAWMGIRLCLHSVEDDFATFRLFSGAASDVIGILMSCRLWGKMYGGDAGQKGLPEFEELHHKVVSFIPTIYAEILEFSYQMKKHMDRHGAKRLFKGLFSSALNEFKPRIETIRSSERTMSEYARKATDQLSIHYHETSLQNQGVGLQNQQLMMADLAVIKEALDSNRKLFEEEKKNMKRKTPMDRAKDKFEDHKIRLKPTFLSVQAYENSKSRRSEGTCEWIFGLDTYRQWHSSADSGLIWVAGVGGMGKSVLISTVISSLQDEMKTSLDSSVQYFICSARDDSTKLSKRIKDQLIYQVYSLAHDKESVEALEQANDLVEKFLGHGDVAGAAKDKKFAPAGFEETYSSLIHLSGKKIYLVLDALDECDDRQESHLLKAIQASLSADEFPNNCVKVIICSRPKADIVDALTDSPVIKIEDHNGPDIERDAKTKLVKLPGLSIAERELATKTIVKKAKGLFRCVDPAVDFLKRPLQRPLERVLDKLPVGLDNYHQQIFRQTDPQYLELLKIALQWTILGERKPTIAEILDDYSLAYTQADGSDINPYDELDNPSNTTETKRLIHDQIREAGSNTFLEVEADNTVKTRHTTVTDFFLQLKDPSDAMEERSDDHVCPECKSNAATQKNWTLSNKQGHLKMATTMFKHLNSSLFRKRYLPAEPNDPETENKTDTCNANSALHGTNERNSVEPEVPAAPDCTRQSHLVSSTPTLLNGDVANPQSQCWEPTLASVAKEEVDARTSHETLENGTATSREKEALGEAAEGEVALDPDPSGQDAVKDEDNYQGDDDRSDIASNSEHDAQDDLEPARAVRYELSYWPHHLAEAESLWTPEERQTSKEWQELWTLVIKFLCNSPGAFRTWQQYYMSFSADHSLEDVILTPLQVAAGYGLTGLCKVLIEHGESVAEVTADGRSALYFAAQHGIELQKLLLGKGGDPNSFINYPPPFHLLLESSPTIDQVRLMLHYNADCKLHGQYACTAVHTFALYGTEVAIFNLLLEHGGEINATDQWGETALHNLLWQDPLPLPLLNALIESGADINFIDKDGQQPLWEVCCKGSAEGCRILLDHGADIQHADSEGATALRAAAGFSGSLDCVKLLTERGASITRTDNHERTPFYHACAEGHAECAKHLISAAHDQDHHETIYQAGADGRTPFGKACGRGHYNVVRAILAHTDVKVDIDAVEGPLKRTALHFAAHNARVDVVLLLLENGANAMVKDNNGKTALSLAGASWWKDKSLRREPMIIALIEYDSATAAEDTSLISMAAIRGSTKVIEKLLDARALPNQQDEHGWTPLQLARQYGHADAAAILSKRGAVVGSRPSQWITELHQFGVSEDGKVLEYLAKGWEPHCALSNHPVPAGIERFYFEVEVKADIGPDAIDIGIGFSTQPARFDHFPGYPNPVAPSWVFYSDPGSINPAGNDFELSPYGKGSVVGCGVIYQNGIDGRIFFTRDGEPLGVAYENNVLGQLYPSMGMGEPAKVLANFGDDLQKYPFRWQPANSGFYDLDMVKSKGQKAEDGEVVVPTRIEIGPPVTVA